MRLFKTICFAACLAAFLPSSLQAVEITVTDSLVLGVTDFYTQSSSGTLLACGIEFHGTDSKFNHFRGSYGFMYFEQRGAFPILKVKSLKLKSDDSKVKRLTIKNAWLKTPRAATLGSKQWVSNNEGDSFLLIGRDVETGVTLYHDLVSGEETTVGYLHAGERIDRVYKLAAFPQGKYEASTECLLNLLKRAAGQQ